MEGFFMSYTFLGQKHCLFKDNGSPKYHSMCAKSRIVRCTY